MVEDKLKVKEGSIMELKICINDLKKELDKQEEEIADLKTRLKASFQADRITQNQELLTLKRNISSAISLQYKDFIENKDVPCNEDNYEALKNALEYIFRVLKRGGIEL